MDTAWIVFGATAVASCVVLYLPGWLLFSGLGLPRLRAAIFAPAASIALLQATTLLWDTLGIACTVVNVFGPAVGLSLLAFLARMLFAERHSRGKHVRNGNKEPVPESALVLLFSVAIGIAVGFCVFISQIGSPEAIMQEVDATSHLRILQSFSQSGRWSPFGPSGYQAAIDAAIAPAPQTGGFYPVAWHIVAVLAMKITGASTTVATNALGFVVAAVVFPASMYLLLHTLDTGTSRLSIYGAALGSLFAAFPWKYLAFGPLYPNLLAYALLPLFEAGFIVCLAKVPHAKDRVRYGFVAALGLCALVAAQPNAVFTAGVFLAPFCLWAITGTRLPHGNLEHASRPVWGKRIAFIVAVAIAWVALYKAPFMQGVIHGYAWPPSATFVQAAQQAATAAYMHAPQWALAALVVIGLAGAAGSLVAKRAGALASIAHLRWVVIAFLAFAVIYIFGIGTDGTAKRLLAGFWYADPYRLAANLALAAIPVACMGASVIDDEIRALLRHIYPATTHRIPIASVFSAIIVAFCACMSLSVPLENVSSTALENLATQTADEYRQDANTYDSAEQSFVSRVKREIGEDTLVYNNPDDGSVFAYGADGLRVKYRSMSYNYREDPRNEYESSKVVRTQLNQINESPLVANAAAEAGANYLLLLDVGESIDHQRHFNDWLNPDAFAGIQAVDDTTPGFEVVLQEGDMRLYRIVAPERQAA